MAFLPIEPLDGADGYLRWKESVLLRLHTAGVAHVLSDHPPPPAGDDDDDEAPEAAAVAAAVAAAKQSPRSRTACFRTTPATAPAGRCGAPWRAPTTWRGAPLLEQLAHAEALAIAAKDSSLSGASAAHDICRRLPAEVTSMLRARIGVGNCRMTMDNLWRTVLSYEVSRLEKEDQELLAAEDSEEEHGLGEGKAARRHPRRQGKLV
ncbi:hypothetical protein ACP4OV_016759 [Aristida adscensionis]